MFDDGTLVGFADSATFERLAEIARAGGIVNAHVRNGAQQHALLSALPDRVKSRLGRVPSRP